MVITVLHETYDLTYEISHCFWILLFVIERPQAPERQYYWISNLYFHGQRCRVFLFSVTVKWQKGDFGMPSFNTSGTRSIFSSHHTRWPCWAVPCRQKAGMHQLQQELSFSFHVPALTWWLVCYWCVLEKHWLIQGWVCDIETYAKRKCNKYERSVTELLYWYGLKSVQIFLWNTLHIRVPSFCHCIALFISHKVVRSLKKKF